LLHISIDVRLYIYNYYIRKYAGRKIEVKTISKNWNEFPIDVLIITWRFDHD